MVFVFLNNFLTVLFHVEKGCKIHGYSKIFQIYSQLKLEYYEMFVEESDESEGQYWRDKNVFLPHDCESNKVLLNFLYGGFQSGFSLRPSLLYGDNQYLESIRMH